MRPGSSRTSFSFVWLYTIEERNSMRNGLHFSMVSRWKAKWRAFHSGLWMKSESKSGLGRFGVYFNFFSFFCSVSFSPCLYLSCFSCACVYDCVCVYVFDCTCYQPMQLLRMSPIDVCEIYRDWEHTKFFGLALEVRSLSFT